jgi:hypothetical protein
MSADFSIFESNQNRVPRLAAADNESPSSLTTKQFFNGARTSPPPGMGHASSTFVVINRGTTISLLEYGQK